MASKADQKNEARLKREAAQAAAAAASKRNRNLQVLGGIIFAAVVVVVMVVVISGGDKTKGPTGLGTGDGEIVGVAETNKQFEGIEQSGFALGDPKAPVTVIEFLDVQCPFCKTHQLDEQPTIIKELVRTGKARLRMAPIALPQMGQDSVDGRVVAARLAAKGKAWNFVNLFYWNQGDEGTGYVTDAFLTGIVTKIPGTTSADTDRTTTPEIDAKLKEIDELQQALGVTGTPSFAIGKAGQEPAEFELLTLDGTKSAADQVVDAANELAEKAGV